MILAVCELVSLISYRVSPSPNHRYTESSDEGKRFKLDLEFYTYSDPEGYSHSPSKYRKARLKKKINHSKGPVGVNNLDSLKSPRLTPAQKPLLRKALKFSSRGPNLPAQIAAHSAFR